MGWNTPEVHKESVASQDDLNHGLQNAFVDMVKNGTMHKVQEAMKVFQLPPAGDRDEVLDTLSIVLNRYFNALETTYEDAIKRIAHQPALEKDEDGNYPEIKLGGEKDREDIRRLVLNDVLVTLDENVVWGKAASELKEGEVAMKPTQEQAQVLGIAHKLLAESVAAQKEEQKTMAGPHMSDLSAQPDEGKGMLGKIMSKLGGSDGK